MDKEQETSAPGSTSGERPCKSPAEKTCSDPQLDGWALQKARSGAARFTTAVKQSLTAKFDLGERTGNKADPGKVAADMRTARNPDSSRIFDRKAWLTKGQVHGFFSRLSATRRKQGNPEVRMEDAHAEQEEQERLGLLSDVVTQLSTSHPICYDSYCLCDLLRDHKLNTFSVVMLKEILAYFGSKDRKKNLVANLSIFLEGCDCRL